MKTICCELCGGIVVDGKQRYAHANRCKGYKEDGVDHITCQECGYRSTVLSRHIPLHGMTVESYREKYPDAPLVMGHVVSKRNMSIKSKGGYKPICEKRGAKQCPTCNDWYQPETAKAHRRKCVEENPEAYQIGKDYIRCPDCSLPMLRLGRHLKAVHGWSEDKIALEKGKGLQMTATAVTDNRLAKQDMKATKEKRETTNLKRYGVKNAGATKESRQKAIETSQRRYGVDHAMQDEDVRIRQYESAQCAPSKLEAVFDSLTPDSVVFTGYGGRFIRCKVGVEKYGRTIKDLNPDFMVLPDNVLESARSRSAAHGKLSREKHRTKYVIELLGDYYHSEKVIGVPPERHGREIIDAYASAGIECLVLWEHEVLDEWELHRERVLGWISEAIAGINANPVWKKK